MSATKTSPKRIAIITGASSGMGRECARAIDKTHEVDEFWLIARRSKPLEDLSGELSSPVRCLSLDITSAESRSTLTQMLEREAPHVHYLVNAAGFGKFGDFEHIANADTQAMVDLNCTALTMITQSTLPYMQRGSHIIQFASVAAFLSLPHLNVYAASKAYVLSYTRALRWELAGRGITATAVCPAWVKTEFEEVARKTDAQQDVRHLLFAQKPTTVVRRALRANKLHFAVATCGVVSLFLRVVCKFLPRCVTMLGWELIRRL